MALSLQKGIFLKSFFAAFFIVAALFGFYEVVYAAPTVTVINPTNGTNNTTTAITSVTGTGFASGWDKETGLVGNWRLDENTGTAAADVSGNNNNGTLLPVSPNGPTWTTGKLGSALNFDGVDDIVNIPASAAYDNMGEITVSAWIKPNGYGESNRGRIVDKANAVTPTNGWTFFVSNTTANIIQFIIDGSTDLNLRSSAGAIQFGVWTHVAVTWNGNATCSGNAIIYINGVADTVCTANLVSRTADQAEILKIGNAKSIDRTFNGIIDEVRIYNRSLSATEIAELYNASIIKPSVKLKKSSQSDVICTGFTLTSSTTLSSGDCPLNGAATGAWDVQVQNGDATTGTLAAGFTVNDPLPGAPGTPTYSSVTEDTLTANWTSASGVVSYYKLERAPDNQGSPGTFAQIATTTSLSYDDSGLSSGTTYWYRARATNATGDSSYSANSSVTTNAAPTLFISQPDGVSDTVTVGTAYNVTYTLADTDNVVTAAFYYDTNATGLDGVAITGACATAAEGTGVTCSWNTTGMTSGSYYVYGITTDQVNPQVSAYSSGMITINASTIPTVTAINPTSGTNNGTTSITSVTGTGFASGWDKENGLIGNWRLDEVAGGNATDSSGNSNTGTANGTATTTGQVNNARTFNGSTDDITITNSASLDFSGGSVTISAWIKPTSVVTAKQVIVEKSNNTTAGFRFITSDTDGDRLKFIRGSLFADSALSNDNILTAGVWQHIAVSFNGTTASFYVNGTARGSGNPPNSSIANTFNIKIGEKVYSGSSAVNFTGSMDEVRVYNRVLSATEVAELYNATANSPSLKLKKSGQSDIVCTDFTLTSSTTLSSGSCPLSGVAIGAWDVQVQNGNSATGTLTSGFTVNGASANPDATSVTYTTGGDGGISGDSITITGTNFGTVSSGSRANCSGSTGTGCVKFIVGGTDTVADASVTSWSAISIVFTVPAALASNGGAAALQVFAASASDTTPLAFYIYPNVTAVASVGSNAGREYNAADTDGLIMLSGDHFGTAGTATILSQSATQHATTGGNCTVGGYATTTACYEVPTAISDTLYSGNIVLTRTSDLKTNTWTNFRILPRILANNPTAGPVGTTIQITGDHFCETGTCPVSPNRSASTDNVKFGSTQVADSDFVTSTSGATTVTSASLLTSGTNRLLLAFVSIKNNSSQTVSSVTNSGTALTWVSVASTTNSTNVRLEVWRALATSAFLGTVTATLSSSAKATIVVSAFSGVNTGGTNGSGAVGVTGSAMGNSTAPSVAITTSASSSLVISALAAQGTPAVTAGSGQTLISTQTTTGGADSTRVTGAGERQNNITTSPQSVTSNYSLGTASNWATIAVEIKK